MVAVQRGCAAAASFAQEEGLGAAGACLPAMMAVAWAMAQGVLDETEADVAVAVTGIAGPGGSEFKPEGRVCFGLAMTGRPTRTETQEFGAPGRAEVRRLARDHALRLLRDALSS